MAKLADLLAPDLRILLVAINPAPASFAVGEHFATPTNGFWKLLFASGLTPRLYAPTEAKLLLKEGIGLTSFVERPTRMASEVSRSELRDGAARLANTVKRWKPGIVALLGVTLLPFVLPDSDEAGPGPKRATFAGTPIFVLPNPSGRNRAYPGIVGKLPYYRALATFVGMTPTDAWSVAMVEQAELNEDFRDMLACLVDAQVEN